MFHRLFDVSFKGYTLLIPSVSVGNVGQLSVDLIISSLRCAKAGFLWHKAIVPLVGADPFENLSSSIALGAEVYHSQEHKLVLVQLRSSILRSHQKDFLEELVKWVKSEEVSEVVILTGSSNDERIDEQIRSEPFRFVMCNASASRHAATFSELRWIDLERRTILPRLAIPYADELPISEDNIVIPGGGFARKLYEHCCQSQIPCVVLIKFCSDGDNIPDALTLTNKINTWLHILKEDANWTLPPSWRFLFGNPPPEQLY